MNLSLYARLPQADTLTADLWYIPSVRETWTRIISANGGFLSGSFELSRMPQGWLKDFYNRYIGYRVRERAFGHTSWEGIIHTMTLELGNVRYTVTLDPAFFHNKVNVFYSNLAIVDEEQAVLNYLTVPLRFQDTGQDFSTWATGGGVAIYSIRVTNTDGTVSWGYCGAASTVTNPNDTIAVYQDENLGTPGWNDTDPIGPPAKTAAIYQVVEIELDGTRANTGWNTVNDSIATFGTLEYVISLGGADGAAADALRDRHLAEYGFPRSRMTGGAEFITRGEPASEARLTVQVAGLVSTMFWEYLTYTATGDIGTLITNLANACDYVYAYNVAGNATTAIADGYPMPQRIGDIVQGLVDQGDAFGNIYQWGVFESDPLGGRFVYEEQPTTPAYYIHRGRLLDTTGQIVIPPLLRAGFLVRSRNAPTARIPYGGASFDQQDVAYVTDVEFTMPDILRLTLASGDEIVLEQQIQAGAV